jgi:hypothetical protein
VKEGKGKGKGERNEKKNVKRLSKEGKKTPQP